MSSRHFFGTDGIRGRAGEMPMTAAFAFRIGAAAAEIIQQDHAAPKVLVGMDTRHSGSMLMSAVSAGLASRGAHVLELGVIPTPGVSFLTQKLEANAGVVVSASHNPFFDNGIKFFNHEGKKLADSSEASIEVLLEDVEQLPAVTGMEIGTIMHYDKGVDHYISYLLQHAPYLDGLRVGLDCANGATSAIAPKVMQQIGARLDVLNATPNGSNINQRCGSNHPEVIQQRVVDLGLDVGMTFDGDADRVMLVDKRGRLVNGDMMLAICAKHRSEKAVVATIMSNLGLEHYLTENGIDLHRCQVGDRYVHEMLEAKGLSLGGEQSGHMLFLDIAPSGDGLLTALQVLAATRKLGIPLEDWVDSIPEYPQVLKNVPVKAEHKKTLVNHDLVQQALSQAEQRLAGQGRINVRPSGTEALIRVMVEASEKQLIEEVSNAVVASVEAANHAVGAISQDV